ncbi:DUF4381 domain-containing protein [Salinispirillum sp. LH 10-3-1]|uniref:DUF4381 domain-containing protein n=1 Tax=Salinispirillum sp. LH 10-3-1 TaxID=2952525 RepID=A0AB38YJU7_9GAMM
MQDNLLSQLAPPIAPDHLSAWPPGPGWLMLFGLILIVLMVALVYLSRRWPWWRWPQVWRWRRLYRQALEQNVLHASAHSGALNQWIRQLARDGLGIDTTLPPEHFIHELQAQLVALPDSPDERMISTVRHLLLQSYQPSAALKTLENETTTEVLHTLCKRCLTLHSPGHG